jgi:hypothetical protein
MNENMVLSRAGKATTPPDIESDILDSGTPRVTIDGRDT